MVIHFINTFLGHLIHIEMCLARSDYLRAKMDTDENIILKDRHDNGQWLII